jgi:hypothetical protein
MVELDFAIRRANQYAVGVGTSGRTQAPAASEAHVIGHACAAAQRWRAEQACKQLAQAATTALPHRAFSVRRPGSVQRLTRRQPIVQINSHNYYFSYVIYF